MHTPQAVRVRRRRLAAGILIGILVGAVHAVVSHDPPAPVAASRAGFALVDVDGTVVAVMPAPPPVVLPSRVVPAN